MQGIHQSLPSIEESNHMSEFNHSQCHNQTSAYIDHVDALTNKSPHVSIPSSLSSSSTTLKDGPRLSQQVRCISCPPPIIPTSANYDTYMYSSSHTNNMDRNNNSHSPGKKRKKAFSTFGNSFKDTKRRSNEEESDNTRNEIWDYQPPPQPLRQNNNENIFMNQWREQLWEQYPYSGIDEVHRLDSSTVRHLISEIEDLEKEHQK